MAPPPNSLPNTGVPQPASSPFTSPPSGGHRTTFLVVGVSIGGAFFLAILLLGLFSLSKKKKRPVLGPVESGLHGTIMSEKDEMQIDVQELDDVGVTSDSGTVLQESDTSGGGPPDESKGPRASTLLKLSLVICITFCLKFRHFKTLSLPRHFTCGAVSEFRGKKYIYIFYIIFLLKILIFIICFLNLK